MKIRILIKENLDKIYNILPIIKKNKYLAENAKNIQYFNEKNWQDIFEKTVKEIKTDETFDRICVFDEDGILPFIFFSKEVGIIASIPISVEYSNLSRSHNNANCIVMSTKNVETKDMDRILTEFFATKSEGGRHATRVKLMKAPFKKSKVIYTFNEAKKNTVIMCSDHAGFNLKEYIKKYLSDKKLNVIDVGCSNPNSQHYPLFAIAMILNAKKASCGIAICSTGFGIANTCNRFRGINAALCKNPQQAKLARTQYNANVLALGAKRIGETTAKSIVDQFIKTRRGKSKFMLPMDNYGYEFDFDVFKKVQIDENFEIPKELKK